MSQTLHERVYHTSSGNVFYWIDASADTDAPWLVFLPGLTADHTMFDAQMAYFSGKVNCLVWDAPAHGKSRPYPLDFSMDDCARILHAIMEAESIKDLVLVGQSVGGYVAQAFIDLYPREAAGFVSIDSAPLKRKYYPTWEVKALRHTKWMYQFVPWSWLKALGSWGVATGQLWNWTARKVRCKPQTASFMSGRTTSTHWRVGVHALSAKRRVSTDSAS